MWGLIYKKIMFQFVGVFYLCVVLVLVGTNMRRERSSREDGDSDATEGKDRGVVVEFSRQDGVSTRIVDARCDEEEEGGLADSV